MLTVAAIGTTAMGPIDMNINLTCMALMTHWYDEYYESTCFMSIWIAKNICRCDLEVEKGAGIASKLGIRSMSDAEMSAASAASATSRNQNTATSQVGTVATATEI